MIPMESGPPSRGATGSLDSGEPPCYHRGYFQAILRRMGVTMEIGVKMIITSESMDVARLAQKAESLGFESFWLPEHPIVPVHSTSRYPATADGAIPKFMIDLVDPFIGLARASALTQRMKLGTSICLVPEHNPLSQAKQIATLDRFSNGRFSSASERAG